MIVYVIATCLSLFFASLAAASEREALFLQKQHTQGLFTSLTSKRFFFAVCSALPLILVAALRYEVGTDWFIYSEHFFTINNGGKTFDEEGFNILNRIVYTIYPDFALMVAVCSVITYSFVFKAIYDQSVNYAFSILFYVLNSQYFNTMNQVRQMMTVAIFLYAIKFIKQRKLLPYIFWILLACTIHNTAVLLFPVYFLYGLRVRPMFHMATLALGGVLIVPLSKLAPIVFSKTSYSWYFDSVYVDTLGFYLIGFVFSLIMLFLFDYYYYYAEDKNDKDYNFMVNLYWIAAMMVYLSPSVPQSSRLLLAFVAPAVFSIPKLLLRERVHHRRVFLMILIIVLYVTKLFYDIYQNNWYDIIPYQTIFNQ